MTDVNTNLELDRTAIAAASHQCVELFATCLAQASAIHPREFSRVEDQAARFSTWTSGIGVFAPGRASMDHRIRYAPEVQSVAIGLLDSLNHRIQKCSDIMGDPSKGPELDVLALNQALERAYGDIASEISHLNKMSNVIRRASRESQAMKIKSFKDKDEDTNVERMLFDIYKRYISERFPIASNIIQQRLAEAMIFRRKRILYWRYRQQGTTTKLPIPSFNISITLPEPQQPAPSAQVDLPQEDKRETRDADPVVVTSEIQSATTLQPENFKSAATSPSVSSSVTIALSGHETLKFPTAPGANVKRRYQQLRAERLAAHKIVLDKLDKAYPDNDSRRNLRFDKQNSRAIAEEDLKRNLEADIRALGEITCPYCLEALPAIEVFDDRKWRKHVRNDLDPYVCLFEECNEAGELYKHSENWIIHMRQHNQRWRCPSHRDLDPFLTRELYMQHMREAHKFELGEKKLLILASRNARKATKPLASCPLCGKGEAEADGSLEIHVTGHLRSLALTSLPPYQEDLEADVGSRRDSCDDSQRRSVRVADDLSTTKGSLTDETNDELSKLSEIEDTDFVNDAPSDLDSWHTDMWGSWVKDWISNKPTLLQLQQTSDKDPIFQIMQEKVKEIHSLSQTLQQQQQPNQPLPYERTPFPPADSADQNPACNTLYVGNLPIDADEEELKVMFAKQRGYKRLYLRTKDNRPRCFVEFEDASSATRAMHELNGNELHNSTNGGIRLSFSKNPLGVRSGQSPRHASQENVLSNDGKEDSDGKEAAGKAKVEYNYAHTPLVHIGHVVDTGGKGNKREQQNQQALGPYTFTHHQLEREGVIQKSNISDGRRYKIYFKFTSPSPGTFVISLHMEGRIRGLLELNLKINDLLEMQKDNEDELDLEYIQFNVPKLLIFLPKTFVWGQYGTPFSGSEYGWLRREHFRPPVTLETDILDPFSPANMIVEDS